MKNRCVALLGLSLAACSGEIGGPDGVPDFGGGIDAPPFVDVEPETVQVLMAVEDHESLDADVIRDACASWTGMDCVVSSYDEAALSVVADASKCEPREEDGKTVLGMMSYLPLEDKLLLTIYVSCFVPSLDWNVEEPFDAETFFIVLEHELGHGLGIDHVASVCDGSEQKYAPLFADEAGTVCGPARMNPFVNGTIEGLTELDWRAFAVRRPGFLWPKEKGSPDMIPVDVEPLPEESGDEAVLKSAAIPLCTFER